MDHNEALQMMHRCLREIESLRAQIDRLTPKAEAYENLQAIIRLMPRGGSVVASEDLVWALRKRIESMGAERAATHDTVESTE